MQRRHFLQVTGAGAALAGLPAFAAAAAAGTPADIQPDAWTTAFDAAARRDPWLEGYRGVQSDIAETRLTLEGRLPADLRGVFYRNGPARNELPGLRYHHWFDGDGMLQRFAFDGRGVTHFGRFVRTPKFVAEEKAGRPLLPAFGTVFDGMRNISAPDQMNVANISVLQHHGEMMALWEGGSATLIDPDTLATRGFKTWRDDYAGMPFSAHPKVETDGTLWNFGVSSGPGLLSIYRIAPSGELLAAATQKVERIGMIHDFAVTQQHLVFLVPPFVFNLDRTRQGESFLDAHEWKPELGMRVFVVDKNDLTKRREFALPPGMMFHIGNAWEEDEEIRIDFMRSDDATLARKTLRDVMRGVSEPVALPHIAIARIDLKRGTAKLEQMDLPAEFPKVDPRRVAQRHRDLYVATSAGNANVRGFNAVMRVDMDSGKVDRYRYGDDVMVEEHLLVPRGGAEGQGWLIGTAFDAKKLRTVLSVFDARSIAAGPIAQATLVKPLPLGLHGTFIAG
jgi:carotenoid cleavage dioxygenase